MSLKANLTRALWQIEDFVERLLPGKSPENAVIEPYLGYSTPNGVVLRGRLHDEVPTAIPREGQGRAKNVGQMLALFATDELPGVRVVLSEADVGAVSDEEGYFTIELPRPATDGGWTEVMAEVEGKPDSQVGLPVLVTRPEANLGIISDIDDTMMDTGAYSLARNLWTTFTGNTLTRHVFPDAVELIGRLHDGRNPVFFVSSSPWNLHGFLAEVFRRAGMVRGPIFLRDLGLGETQLVTNSHGEHKGESIDTILAANPTLPFVLIGDTGQHDAEVYLAAAKRHPDRIRRIILRAPGPGADEADKAFATEAAALGIDVSIGRDYRNLILINPGETAQPDRSAT